VCSFLYCCETGLNRLLGPDAGGGGLVCTSRGRSLEV